MLCATVGLGDYFVLHLYAYLKQSVLSVIIVQKTENIETDSSHIDSKLHDWRVLFHLIVTLLRSFLNVGIELTINAYRKLLHLNT